jgi:hypothetical protein
VSLPVPERGSLPLPPTGAPSGAPAEGAARPCTDLAPLEAILARYPHEEPALIQVLQDVQRAYRYLPCDVLAKVAEALNVPLSRVFSVATFYKAFSLNPQGRCIVKVCMGTACHIRGGDQLVEEVERRLAIHPGETTAAFSSRATARSRTGRGLPGFPWAWAGCCAPTAPSPRAPRG